MVGSGIGFQSSFNFCLCHFNRSSFSKVGAMDMCNATFLQSQYSVVYNPVAIRQTNVKECESPNESEQDSSIWRYAFRDKVKACISRGVNALQVTSLPSLITNLLTR